ncbi:hypothetical protein Q7P37_007729 [Cladosporium fusiforme]
MNRRKFSFDLPRLKLPFKPEHNNLPPGVSLPHAMQPMDPESPGEVPKSVRPLPNDIDFALRTACTGVVRNNKPSHEYHKNGKAQLDYATIRRGGGTVKTAKRPEQPTASLSKTDSNEERLQQQQQQQQYHPPPPPGPLSAGLMSPGKMQRMSNISAPAEVQPQNPEGEGQVTVQQRSRAQSRADQLMGGASPPKMSQLLRERTNSHSRSQSSPQVSWTNPPPKIAAYERPKPAPRAHSMENSSPQPESTDYTWSTRPAMTSMNMPARSSSLRKPVRSTSEAQNCMKVDAYDAEWMREESERRRLLQQQAYAEAMASRHATWVGPKSELEDALKGEKKAPADDSQTPTPIIPVPARKPVGSARRESTLEPQTDMEVEADFEASSPELDLSLDDPARLDSKSITYEEPQHPPRPESRNARGRTRGTNVPMNSRAASRARSITREVKDFMRNASRHRQPRESRARPDEPHTRSRRPSMSRTRDVATNVIDYFRPGTSVGGTKQSLDIPRNGANLKSKSHESLVSARSPTAKDTPMQLNSQRSSQQPKQSSTYTDARSRNSMEDDDDDRDAQRYSSGSEAQQSKREVDLNRALPPLPRLDSYHVDDEPTQTEEFIQPPKQVLEPPQPHDSGDSAHLTRTSTREAGKSPLPSPKLPTGVHDFVALRMGAPVPVSRQSSRAKLPRNQMNPNLVHQARPSMGKRAPTDPRYSRIQADPSTLQSPSQISLAKRETARRRSKSVQEVNAPDLSEKLRKASANAPDGKPIRAVGQAKLVNTSPAPKESDGFASKLGRKLSTRARSKRNITPTPSQQPPIPPQHQDLPQRFAKTASNTPGLSRSNSEYRSEHRHSLSRKMSMEEYGRMYDGRFHKNNSTLTAPPPVAVSNSKSSPRLGLGNFLPQKNHPQHNQHSPQPGGSKKWWHLGLGNGGGGDKDTPMDDVPRHGSTAEHGPLGVRF